MTAFIQLLAIFWGPYLIVGAWIKLTQLIQRR
jgi:hypothetical protein